MDKMDKKKAVLLTLLALTAAALLYTGYSFSHRASQTRREQEQARQEQEERGSKITEAQERLLSENAQEEAAAKETDETPAAPPEQTLSGLSADADPGLEGEAQIEKPSGRSASGREDNGELEGIEGLDDLKAQLESMLGGYEGDWSIYAADLTSQEYLTINSHAVKAASLIKLYIMGAVLEQIDAGNLSEDARIDQLLHDMITVSDNESSNELVRLLSPDGTDHAAGMEVVNAFAKSYGYNDTSQGRDLQDVRDTPPPGENYTSVRDCGLFLKRVYDRECVSPEASDKMLELLRQQTRTWKIPAGVPEGVPTANKTGELSDTENDTAIVFAPGGDYILCITATGLPDTSTAQANIVALSGAVYQYMDTSSS